MKTLCLFLLSLLCCCRALGAAAADTQPWALHLAYHDATRVVAHGTDLYALLNGNLLQYHTTDGSVVLHDKLGGLSDKGIAFIDWCDEAGCLVIVYTNNNVDFLYADGEVANLPQVKDYTETSITVRNLTVSGQWAALATTEGVVLLNAARAEVKAYYRIGRSVRAAAVLGDRLLAATDEGILEGLLTDNLYDINRWTKCSPVVAAQFYPTAGGAYLRVPAKAGVNDNYAGISFLGQPGSDGQRTLTRVTYVEMSGGMVANGRKAFVGSKFLITVGDEKPLKEEFRVPTDKVFTDVAYTTDGTYWFVDTDKQLTNAKLNGEEKTLTETGTEIGGYGPRRDYAYNMHFAGERLLVAGGRMDYSGKQYEPTAMAYENGKWVFFEEEGFTLLNNAKYRNVTSIVQDPNDASHHYVTTTSGLVEFRDYKFVQHFNASNSTIEIAPGGKGNPNYAIVDGLAFDDQGNLWMTNYETDENLRILKPDGQWESYQTELFTKVSTPERILKDRKGRLWVTSRRTTGAHTSGLLGLDFGGTLGNTADDHVYFRTSAPNEDGTTCSFDAVKAICEDLNGQIWFGCSAGVFAVQDPDKWFQSSGFSIYQPKVPRNDGTNYADYLLTGIDVSAIAVDGGNRKWLGTIGSGIYLVSPDGSEVIEHYTTANSPILSDNIFSLAVHPASGELWIGTDVGICSFRTGTTPPAAQLSEDNVKVFPNPVRPGYRGKVTIAGLTDGAEVKIATASGQLVARGTAVGGSYQWDVRHQGSGDRVAAGVYYIYVSTADGSESVAAKVIVV